MPAGTATDPTLKIAPLAVPALLTRTWTKQTELTLMFCTYNWERPGSNQSRDTNYPDEQFRDFASLLRANMKQHLNQNKPTFFQIFCSSTFTHFPTIRRCTPVLLKCLHSGKPRIMLNVLKNPWLWRGLHAVTKATAGRAVNYRPEI